MTGGWVVTVDPEEAFINFRFLAVGDDTILTKDRSVGNSLTFSTGIFRSISIVVSLTTVRAARSVSTREATPK